VEIQILPEFLAERLLANPVGEVLVDVYCGILKPLVKAALVPVVAVST
jgi:hypothetical protein